MGSSLECLCVGSNTVPGRMLGRCIEKGVTPIRSLDSFIYVCFVYIDQNRSALMSENISLLDEIKIVWEHFTTIVTFFWQGT